MNIITLPTRVDLIALFPQGSRIAEIGVHKGEFACKMLDLPNLGRLYLVDPWVKQEGYSDPLTDDDHESNLKDCLHNLRGHIQPRGRVEIIRKSSLDAANEFNEGQLDGVFIDADHSYDAVLSDLRAWSRVVKPTGMICGHDHTNCPQAVKWNFGVIEAVAKFCAETDWKLRYITDEQFASFGLVK